MCFCILSHNVVAVILFFQRDKLRARSALQWHHVKSMFACCGVKPSTVKQNQQQSCLWVAIWWVSLCGSLREPFFLRWNNFVQKWTSSLSPPCSSDPAPSPTSEITQRITGPTKRPGAGMATRTSQVDLHKLCHVCLPLWQSPPLFV